MNVITGKCIVVFSIAGFCLMSSGQSVPVKAAPSECHGILHNDQGGGLAIGGGDGEGESVCLIKRALKPKVLAVCSIGHFCRVRGIVGQCGNSGECDEFKRVYSVKGK